MLLFEVNGQTLKRTDHFNPASDSQEYLKARFTFKDSAWSGKTKTALFRNGSDVYKSVLASDGSCKVPSEVLVGSNTRMARIHGETLYISLIGEYSTTRITTNELAIKINLSGFGDAEIPANPTETEYQQITKVAADAVTEAENAREALVGVYNLFANGIKGNLSGKTVSADDVSPIEHELNVWVHGKNLINPDVFSSSVTTNGVTATRNGDVITLNGTVNKAGGLHLGYLSLELPIGTDISVSLHDVSGSIIDGVNPIWFTMAQGDTPKNSGGGSVSAIWKNGTLKNATGKTENKYLSLFYIWVETSAVFNNFTFKIQVEIGGTPTDYEPWIDPTTVTVTADGSSYTPVVDGSVSGISSVALEDGITTTSDKITVECEYIKDSNKVIEKLTNAIIALGGSV